MLSKKDLVIVSCLRNNARETLTRMSKQLHIPVSTIYDRLKIHENTIIEKHTTLIDFSKLGYNARANVLLKTDKDHRDALLQHLRLSQHTNSLYKINNGFDFLVELVFRNIRDLEDYLELIDHKFSLQDRHVYFIIEDLKREGFLSDVSLVDLAV